MARSSSFKTRPESGEPAAARRAGSRAMTTLDFSGAALSSACQETPASDAVLWADAHGSCPGYCSDSDSFIAPAADGGQGAMRRLKAGGAQRVRRLRLGRQL